MGMFIKITNGFIENIRMLRSQSSKLLSYKNYFANYEEGRTDFATLTYYLHNSTFITPPPPSKEGKTKTLPGWDAIIQRVMAKAVRVWRDYGFRFHAINC